MRPLRLPAAQKVARANYERVSDGPIFPPPPGAATLARVPIGSNLTGRRNGGKRAYSGPRILLSAAPAWEATQ